MSLLLRSVSRRYGAQLALDAVDLEVRPGECVGFIGHNGAGKTTAMRVALGLVEPSSGAAFVDGFAVRRHPREAHARMGALIERPSFFDGLDAGRNLRRLAAAQGLAAGERKREIERVLGLVGLAEVGGKRVGAFSQGMRQRLGIAQALLGSPRYLLLDEPANGLDPEGLAEMRALVERLAHEEGHGILLSSHLLGEVAEVCDRIAVMKSGRLLLEGPCGEILARGGRAQRLVTTESDRAAALLAARGLEVGRRGEELRFDPDGQPLEEIARELVAAGVPLRAFAPERASLEAIYLGLERDAAAPALREDPAPEPAPVKTPGFGVWRAFRWELSRLFGGVAGWALLLAPALIAVVAIGRRAAAEAARSEKLAAEGIFHERATAFGAVAHGLAPSLPLLAVLLALLASQSIAGELGRGTLRNLVLRPFRRWEILVGKAAALGGAALLAYGLLAAGVLGASAWWFDFVGLAEVLPNGELFETVAADDLRPALKDVFLHSLAPLLGFAGLGFLCGAIVRQGTTALGLTLLAWYLEAVVRGDLAERARDLDAADGAALHPRWMLSSYLPSVFGDTSSPVRRYEDLAGGVSDAARVFQDTLFRAPLAWAVLALLLSFPFFSRRSIS
ncbi:MAG: ABC transporter ATP-binding protein [Planctomycetota bacterium]